MFESPIEYMLTNALLCNQVFIANNLQIFSQVPMVNGKYRADLVIANCVGLPLCVIECDGRAFHANAWQMKNDYTRTKAIQKFHGIRVLRFSGTQIYNNAIGCAQAIMYYLMSGEMPNKRFSSHKRFNRKAFMQW